MPQIQSRFVELLRARLQPDEVKRIPELTRDRALQLIDRIDSVRLFSHTYALLANLTYGEYGPYDVLELAYEHELAGACIHLLDGEQRSLSQLNDQELRAFGDHARSYGLDVHLEISATAPADIDEAVRIARLIGVTHLRGYSRYEGRLSEVMDRIEGDLRYIAEVMDRHEMHFSFEQHEELKGYEIAELLRRVDHPRLHALFDFGNMINAGEQPMDALRDLAPYTVQAHLKGVHIMPEEGGNGHRGVLMGSPEDDLPGARMLYEVLMLGDEQPQVVALALEQENLYRAPAFRRDDEDEDPFIPYRDMSSTDVPEGYTLAGIMHSERRWAVNQITHVRELLTRMRELAECRIASDSQAGAQ